MVPHGRLRRIVGVLAAALAIGWAPAEAQLLGGLPNLPVVGGVQNTLQNTVGGVGRTALGGIERLRDTVGRPRSAPSNWGRDPQGAPIVRGEILAMSPSEASLAAARGLGLTVLRTETIAPLGLAVVVLQVPDTTTPAAAMARLRAADPQGQYDFNHIYNPGGASLSSADGAQPPAGAPRLVGMIDGGVDAHHPALWHTHFETAGFVEDCRPEASDHGTAVAFLLTGGGEERPLLFAADVFCGRPDGGNAEAIARAMAWMANSHVPVVNISLAGPPNVLLAAATRALVARGLVIVAAAGNDGPAAGVRYPAAYPGVVAVTSVDDADRIEIDAGQGDAIAFAARGVKVRAAKAGGGYAAVTGTSFAAPVVARRFAMLMDRPDASAAAAAFCILQRQAVDLGAAGRDPVFGYGLLSADASSTQARCGPAVANRQTN